MAKNVSQQEAEEKAAKATAVGLVHGMCHDRYSAPYKDELLGWVKERCGGTKLRDFDRFFDEEIDRSKARSSPGNKRPPLEAHEVAKILLNSKWLANGAKGIFSFDEPRYREWLVRIIEDEQQGSDIRPSNQRLLSASMYHSKIPKLKNRTVVGINAE